MKTIEIDDELYQYIASQTQHIGESASSILRRLLKKSDVLSATDNKNIDVTALTSLIQHEGFIAEKKIVNKFLSLLSALYSGNHGSFSVAAASLHGSKRRYLAKDEATLLQSGSNTKPKQISNTPYWVMTNSNTARKVYILESMMRNMGASDSIIQHIIDQFTCQASD